ncbi:MAG: hypothetical protein HGB11_12865 [Chlorobiales bacterium]|nr:hypothetical protein [Chlorobiales bacterium]
MMDISHAGYFITCAVLTNNLSRVYGDRFHGFRLSAGSLQANQLIEEAFLSISFGLSGLPRMLSRTFPGLITDGISCNAEIAFSGFQSTDG